MKNARIPVLTDVIGRHATGSFVPVDEATNATAAAGTVATVGARSEAAATL